MKNLKSLLITMVCLTFTVAVGCKQKEPKELIVNSWKVKSLKWEEANKMPDSLTKEIEDHTTIAFTADNKYTFTGEEGVIQSGSYTLSGDGKSFTLVSEATGTPEINSIKELSNSKLIFVDPMGNEFTTEN